MTAIPYLGLMAATFVILAWSADRFVDAAGTLALRLGMPLVLVGLVIVGFGTSAPEILVSALAALSDNTGLAVGNALGSNIANIALILGLAALLVPLTTTFAAIRLEYLALLIATLGLIPLLLDRHLGRLEGALLLILLAGILVLFVLRARGDGRTPVTALPAGGRTGPTLGWLAVSLCLLLLSAHLLVWAATALARMAGVSDLVIGLSIVALGTSLPELATSIAAVRKRQFGMVLGNILGSNLFNILAVLGTAVLITPTTLASGPLVRDYGLMTALTLLLGVLLLWRGSVGRVAAAFLVLLYVSYQATLFLYHL